MRLRVCLNFYKNIIIVLIFSGYQNAKKRQRTTYPTGNNEI